MRENLLRGPSTLNARHAAQTACWAGHRFDDANTYIRPDNGGRECRKCRNGAARRAYAKKKSTDPRGGPGT